MSAGPTLLLPHPLIVPSDAAGMARGVRDSWLKILQRRSTPEEAATLFGELLKNGRFLLDVWS